MGGEGVVNPLYRGGHSENTTAGPNIDEVNRLENLVKSEIKKTTTSPRRRVFISFNFEDKKFVDFLRGQSKNDNSELDFIDMSLKVPFNSENAEYIKRGIRSRIEQCSATVVMATENTHKSEWVNWEIKESLRLNKKVIVVDKTNGSKMPTEVEANRDKIKVVSWSHDEIMEAID